MLRFLKDLLRKLPFGFTRNQRYDLLTKKIIKNYCKANSNCVDVGAHNGEFLDIFLKHSPSGFHFGFEPIPRFFQYLNKKYSRQKNCRVYEMALSAQKEEVPFNYVVSNPAYSGIKKRNYDRKHEKDTVIQVQTDLLDHIIPAGLPIHFIKIDVEGGEMGVLEGSRRILEQHQPMVVFEFGLGGSDIYGTTPARLFSFLAGYQYQIYLLDDFLEKKPPLILEQFEDQFYGKKNYYFLAVTNYDRR